MYNVDPDARRETIDRLGPGVERIQETALPHGVTLDDPEPFIEALWETWVQVTFTLIAYGFPQRALCDAAGEMTTVKEAAAGQLVRH